MEYKSRVYQPERLSLSSSDSSIVAQQDINTPGYYSEFVLNLKNPILNVKSVQLLRASIPNALVSIPDTQCVFWYYRLPPSLDGSPVAPALEYLHMIRLLPSTYQQELFVDSANYGWNQYFSNGTQLLTQLNNATLHDPNEIQLTDAGYYIAGDITFGLWSNNRIFFQGNNAYSSPGVVQYFYTPAGYTDPNVVAAQEIVYGITANPINLGNPLGARPTYIQDGQPFAEPNRENILFTLNTRLGFNYSGNYISSVFFYGNCRPIYPPEDTIEPTTINVANGPYNLTYTANCNMYCNLVSGSAYDSTGKPNLLSVIPLNAPTLGISYYNNVLNNPLTKIIKDIYEIRIQLFDDNNDPLLFPESAIVNLEIGFTFV